MNVKFASMIGLLISIWGLTFIAWHAGRRINYWQKIMKDAVDTHRNVNEALQLFHYGAKEEALEIMAEFEKRNKLTLDEMHRQIEKAEGR